MEEWKPWENYILCNHQFICNTIVHTILGSDVSSTTTNSSKIDVKQKMNTVTINVFDLLVIDIWRNINK